MDEDPPDGSVDESSVDAAMSAATLRSSTPMTAGDASIDQFGVDSSQSDAPDTGPCGYRYLGDWVSCFAAVTSTAAATLADCMNECNATAGCSAIEDHSWLGPNSDFGTCDLVIDSMCAPGSEQGSRARTYEKVCEVNEPGVKTIESWAGTQPGVGYTIDPTSPCHFEWSGASGGQYFVCDGYGMTEFEASQGLTLDQCFTSCDQDPNCTAVWDWFYDEDQDYTCVTYVGSCESPRTTGDFVYQFAKVCADL